MTKKLPASLERLRVSSAEERRLGKHLGNWVACHRFLMNLPMTEYETVGRLLVLELGGKRRVAILDRLASRFNHMRAIAFHNEITNYLEKP